MARKGQMIVAALFLYLFALLCSMAVATDYYTEAKHLAIAYYSPNDSEWLFPDSDSRYLTDGDLAGLSNDQLWIARNEIYARRGFIFKTARGKAYARSLGDAYLPVTENPKFNQFEQRNIQFIQSYEKTLR
jgi:hypothetical protein